MAAVHRRIARNRRRRYVLGRPRVFRDRSNPLESLDDFEIYQRYRFRPDTIHFLVNGVLNQLETATKRNSPVPSLLQVLLFLRFVATGAHLRLIGDSLGISESSVGRSVKAVAAAIIAVFAQATLVFPVGEIATKVKEGFRRVAGASTNIANTNILLFQIKFLVSYTVPPHVTCNFSEDQTHTDSMKKPCAKIAY